MKVLQTMAVKTQFEVEVSAMDTSNIKGIITKAYEYHLTHDKVRR